MPEGFQRLFGRSDIVAVQSLNVQAARGAVRHPERSQFSQLVRLFLERFFNHETASASGDAKARVVQIACAAGLPPFLVAMYLWPVYHPFPSGPSGHRTFILPSYWAQVNHHLFFVVYSFVAMGLITVFEWDLIFPDSLDVLTLGTLPIPSLHQLGARITAILILIAGFVVDTNLLAIAVLPIATDPANVFLLEWGHAGAVVGAGLFSAGLVLGVQGLLLAILGERVFRRFSLLLQSAMVIVLLLMLLLFPVLSSVTPQLLKSGAAVSRWFPPFWFLGVFEQHLANGSRMLQSWHTLAHRGLLAMGVVWVVAAGAYPVAHLRRVRAVVQGTSSRRKQPFLVAAIDRLLTGRIVRTPLRRAVYDFISETILRLPRYRIYLALYGGVGFALVTAVLFRFRFVHGALHASVSADGIRISIGILPFWVIAGLRSTFTSAGNQQGGWIFRTIHGRPAPYEAALEQLEAARMWAFVAAAMVTAGAISFFQLVAPSELRTASSLLSQLVCGLGLCLLLTDAFFLNVTSVPFTGEAVGEDPNLALTILRYYTFFPFVTALAAALQLLGEFGGVSIGAEMAFMALAHLWLRKWHRDVVRLHSSQLALEEDEAGSPLSLGLRY